MGTSQSSKGAGAGVPMVPSWVDDPPAEAPTGDQTSADGDGASEGADVPQPVPIAPERRWSGANRSLGEYARNGDRDDMRRGLGRYVRNGYGGSATATRRMGGTAATAGALGNVLSGLASGQPTPDSHLDPALLEGRSADEIMDAVVEAVRPVDGTQDAEASRAAIRDSLSELLTRFPDADLLNLTREQRELAIEHFAALDVFHRFDLDVGQTIREKAPSTVAALSRLKEVKDYIKETVAATFRKLRVAGRQLSAGRISEVVRSALRESFEVFEEYAV